MENSSADLPDLPDLAESVERSVLVDVAPDVVRDALVRPDLLSAWLGEWSESDTGTSVVTDDGVRRQVERVASGGVDPNTVVWRWQPAGLDGELS